MYSTPMNKKRRDLIASAKPFLSKAAAIIEMAAEQESDCMDNIPESLQSTDRYEKMERAVDNLESALEHIESASECIDEAIA